MACVSGERRIGEAVSRERRYHLSSRPADAAAIAAAVRGRWGIENRVHWVLDVAFREDASRVRAGHAAEHVAVRRHIAPNRRRREPSATICAKAKRLKAGRVEAPSATSWPADMRLPCPLSPLAREHQQH